MKRLMLSILLVLCFVTTPASSEVVQEEQGYTFKLDVSTWTDRPRSVHLAGSFQGWNSTATPMSDADGDNIWTVTVEEIPEGTHHYKFVIDGERWIPDPTDDRELRIDDGHGGENSGFVAGPDIRNAPPPKPDHIATDFVLHGPKTDVTAVATDRVRIRCRTLADDVDHVSLTLADIPPERRATAMATIALEKEEPVGRYDTWSVTIDFSNFQLPSKEVFAYALHFQDRNATARRPPMPEDLTPPFELPMFTAVRPTLDVPDWAQHAQWYQIFTERFRNGNPENDPGQFDYERLVPWNGDWWSTLPGEAAGEENFYQGAGNVWSRRYGGDLQGIREKLPYLRKLGINAIYLNPVFEAESMHKYDTADFRHVDDNFGVGEGVHHRDTETQSEYPYAVEGETEDPSTWKWSASDKLFLDFLEEAHAQGFRVIIDGVFNHVGRAHPFFMDVLEKGKNSKYADWFEITDWGDEANWRPMEDPFEVHGKPGGIQWAAWDRANGHLPVFKKDAELGLAPGPREHIMAVTKRWLDPDGDPSTRDGVDGWRLDVPMDIPMPFWRDWRTVVKEANPDAYITGEVWTEAQQWLQGDTFDAVMNYQFAMATQDFFVDERTAIPPTAFAARLEELTQLYPRPMTLALQNLFDSHDTDRLASMFVNPDRPYDGANRLQDNSLNFDGPPYEKRPPDSEEWTRFKQAVVFQQTFVGAPMTYYGNEAGMWSPDDPSNRQPFPWPDQGPCPRDVGFNEDIFRHYQRAIALRNTLPALQTGSFAVTMTDDERGIFAFTRELDEQTVHVVLNRSDEEQIVTLSVQPGMWINYLDPEQTDVILKDAPAARPTLEVVGWGTQAEDGTLKLTLPAWGSAVLVPE